MKNTKNVRNTINAVLSACAIGMTACPAPSQAQGAVENDFFVPYSSIERPQDRGVLFHTDYVVRDPRLYAFSTHFSSIGLGPAGGMTPAQLRSFYKLPTTGGENAIAIVDAYHFGTALNDFNVFAKKFSLPTETSTNATASTNKVFQVVYATGKQPTVDQGWAGEEALDIEWAHAIAPNAKIYLVEAASASSNDLLVAVDKAVSLPGVHQVSMSWGGGEFSTEAKYDSHFVTGKGITFFASTGDNGAAANWPAVSPNVVAVGGTTINTDKTGAFVSETAWSGSGGGISAYEPQPSYQKGVANTNANHRTVPDVSADANPNSGVAVYSSYVGGWFVVGGTSLSAPCFAAMVNLANHVYTDSWTELKVIYADAKIYRDITSGNNGKYQALSGYDFVTGIGSPLGTTGL